MDGIKRERTRLLNKRKYSGGPVAYWMSRDQRVADNWALLFAAELAREHNQLFMVCFALDLSYPGANVRHFDFMIRGLEEVEKDLVPWNIPFLLRTGNPVEEIPKLVEYYHIGLLVTDFDPLRIKRQWKNQLNKRLTIPLLEVDAHNIVPCWIASGKEEYGAYTLRPKIKKLLPDFLTHLPELKEQKRNPQLEEKTDWFKVMKSIESCPNVPPVKWLDPGSFAAQQTLHKFISGRLEHYNQLRNDPNGEVTSDLSPYLHFGQISSHRIAMEIIKVCGDDENSKAFLEELIVRKELSDNFCYYNSGYDNTTSFKPWAVETLQNHMNDEREFMYSPEEFELANTHDPLWNAAQSELVSKGKMHGYMRMYWAKKILEWTKSPEDALKIAIMLNDTYSLDGRDPNGYAGCAWSIGGIHDRPWADRPVFGKIRYMNYNGCKRKFDVNRYVERFSQIRG
jgi:deoxyribodipyrimidine photo-lyase